MNEMTVTSAQWILDILGNNDMIEAVINGQTLAVPIDPDNRHYAEIMRQVDAGDLTIQDAD